MQTVFFGTKAEPLPAFWATFQPRHTQVHGTGIEELTHAGQTFGEVDGFFGQNVPVGIRTADCVPLLLAHQDGSRVGALHSGWKGTFANILRHFFELKATGHPLDWSLWIGPSVRACCYFVPQERLRLFAEKYPTVPQGASLDLVAVIKAQASELNLLNCNIHPSCTVCDPQYFSHRRGDKGRMWSIVIPRTQQALLNASQTA